MRKPNRRVNKATENKSLKENKGLSAQLHTAGEKARGGHTWWVVVATTVDLAPHRGRAERGKGLRPRAGRRSVQRRRAGGAARETRSTKQSNCRFNEGSTKSERKQRLTLTLGHVVPHLRGSCAAQGRAAATHSSGDGAGQARRRGRPGRARLALSAAGVHRTPGETRRRREGGEAGGAVANPPSRREPRRRGRRPPG